MSQRRHRTPRLGDRVEIRDYRTGRWTPSRLRYRVSLGFIADAPWTGDGKTFIADIQEGISWRLATHRRGVR